MNDVRKVVKDTHNELTGFISCRRDSFLADGILFLCTPVKTNAPDSKLVSVIYSPRALEKARDPFLKPARAIHC